MAMRYSGLVKLSEEAGEVIQVAQKLIAYPHLIEVGASSLGWKHPDGTDLRKRLAEELADLSAAIAFTVEKMQLDVDIFVNRAEDKLALFQQWDKEND